ncbi:MAG: hypothetical protein DCC75_08235 [Proteobacteria bacterium]|nr:MAG: hypothetical protein DCC75_08235 [Pseudomonadota bacterium]
MKIPNFAHVAAVILCTCGAACAEGLDEMAAPINHPTIFEDPRPYTEIRPIYIYHKIDNDFVTSGGEANIYAVQLRYAVDDRLGIIATKDGYVDLNADSVLDDQEGFADLSVGVKYAFFRDDAARQIATLGLRYEIPTGEEEVFQGQGDGALNPFLSGAYGLGPVNIMLGTGFRFAFDNDDSSFYDAGLQFDTKIGSFHPVVDFNLSHVISDGNRLAIADEGEDFFNFGASESDGKTLVSAGLGMRVDLADNVIFGVSYQIPLTEGQGSNLLDYRVTSDIIFKL